MINVGDILSTLGVFSTMGDIMSTMGDIMSTMGVILSTVWDNQCQGGDHDARGRYHQYWEGVQYCGRINILLFEYPHSS